MSYFDLDYGRAYRIKTPEVYVPNTKQEILDWRIDSNNSSLTEDDLERMKKQMANTHSNTGWNSYWQHVDPYTSYIPDGTFQNSVSSDEIRQYLPPEYKELSLEELSEKLLEDDKAGDILREAIDKAKVSNVKEKKASEYESWDELQILVEEQFRRQRDQYRIGTYRPNAPYNYSDRTD